MSLMDEEANQMAKAVAVAAFTSAGTARVVASRWRKKAHQNDESTTADESKVE